MDFYTYTSQVCINGHWGEEFMTPWRYAAFHFKEDWGITLDVTGPYMIVEVNPINVCIRIY